MAKGLVIPPHMVSKGLADISKDGLDPDTTDSILAANGTDDTFGEPHLVPPDPYGSGPQRGGAPPAPWPEAKEGGLKTKAGK